MKKTMGLLLVAMFLATVSFAANLNYSDYRTIKVYNNTSQVINVDTATSARIFQKITINGTPVPPSIKVYPHGFGTFVIRNNKYTGDPIDGEIFIKVKEDLDIGATFPIWVGDSYVTWTSYVPSATSSCYDEETPSKPLFEVSAGTWSKDYRMGSVYINEIKPAKSTQAPQVKL